MTTDIYLKQFSTETVETLFQKDDCDKYDYMIAAGCGVIGGIVDVVVGSINSDNIVSGFTDKQIGNLVQRFAEKCGWEYEGEKEVLDRSHSAIKWLEKRFKVNYDQAVGNAAQEIFDLYPKNHHIKSLAHSPDLIGLFFSIIDQFTGTSHFYSPDGRLMIINTNTMEIEGKTIQAKLFAGVVNWFGHLVSDAAGSATSKGRGMGITIPFYSLIELCNFGRFDVNGTTLTVAEIGTKVFTSGYDLRHGITLSIPVLITELSIRFCWAIRRHFQYKNPIMKCIPMGDHDSLQIMLLTGYGCFCIIDAIDAGVKSGGNAVMFAAHLNIFAWLRVSVLGIKQVIKMLGINIDAGKEINSLKCLDSALEKEIEAISQIDMQKVTGETAWYTEACVKIGTSNNIYEMNDILKTLYSEKDFKLPWEGEFEDFMDDPTKHWHFE